MNKKFKIILSIIFPIICIASVCMSFFIPKTKADENINNIVQQTTAEDTGASSAGKDQKGGAVYIENGATYVMRGGTISGMTKKYGGAIYIADGATFTMEAGTIIGCQAKYGGAIYVASGGTCNINGGSITGNKAEYAPAIYVESGATLNISDDAVIENNEYAIYLVVSRDTIVVGNPSANFSLPYIDFGSYPQTYVGSKMNTTLEDWYTANSPTSVNTYVIRTRTWEAYEYTDGNIYARGLSCPYSTSYTYLNSETIVANDSAVWFKVEPIRWIVLNYDEYTGGTDENLEVMSYLILTADIYFNSSISYGNNWESSYIRTWLNDIFYNSAFNGEERDLITTTTVGNNVTGDYSSATSNSSGTATNDNVYLLSYWDYYNSSGIFTDTAEKRLCSPTDFALSNYCWKETNNAYVTTIYLNGGTSHHWTRSAGGASSYALLIDYSGRLNGDYNVTNVTRGIRPVLQLKI